MPYKFELNKIDVIDDNRGQDVYRFNLAQNHALLSGDSAVIRRFYQMKAQGLGVFDIYKSREVQRSFFYNARPTSAFMYVGIIPWITESIVRLVASSGFTVSSPLSSPIQQQGQTPTDTDNADSVQDISPHDSEIDTSSDMDNTQPQEQAVMDEYVKSVCEQIDLQSKFERGVYLESGLGDFAYRISYDSDISDKPIVDVIEPQHLELHYKRGHIYRITIKDSSDELGLGSKKQKQIIEMHETYTKDLKRTSGKISVEYSFWNGKQKLDNKNDWYKLAKEHWGIQDMRIDLPFDDFPIVYKQNSKVSNLYKSERGVPDIHGMDTIEDALSEHFSNLTNAIRKATPKTVIRPDMLPTDVRGTTLRYSDFDTEYLIGEFGDDPSKLIQLLQSRIEASNYLDPARMLISLAINKGGLSPTTLGVTGLESINSSSEAQDAREKPSLRTRNIKLKGWKSTLEELLNKYFQYVAFVQGEPLQDYSSMLDITFNEYINPSTESVLSTIGQAITAKVYSVEIGVVKVYEHEGKDYTIDDIIVESARIRGITPRQEMELLGLIEPQIQALKNSEQEQENNKENKEIKDNANTKNTTVAKLEHTTVRRGNRGRQENTASSNAD